MLGIAVASAGQNQDTGSKVIHIGKNTSSKIIAKSISKSGGIATYRGIVQIGENATNATNSTTCDALLLDDESVSITIPHMDVKNGTSTIAHEASAGKIDEKQIMYLTSRGITEKQAIAMIVNGFFAPVVKKLPLEYAGELHKLIDMEME